MTLGNIEHQLENGTFKTASATPTRLINIGTPSVPLYLIGIGTSVPADGTAGYNPGALFFHTDGTGVTGVLHGNLGSGTSSVFTGIEIS